MKNLKENKKFPAGCSYADDMVFAQTVGGKGRNNDMAKATAIIHRACRELGLKINVSKTKFMLFGTTGKNAKKFQPVIKIEGTTIKWVDQYKYLGVIFDRKLTFQKHVNYLKKSTRNKFNMLKNMAGSEWGTSTDTLIKYYNAAIRSKLEYGGVGILTLSKSASKDLEILQNRALRIIFADRPTISKDVLCGTAGLLPLNFRRNEATAKFIHNISVRKYNHPLFSSYEKSYFRKTCAEWPFTTWAMEAAVICKTFDNVSTPENRNVNEIIEINKLAPWESNLGATFDIELFPTATHKLSKSDLNIIAEKYENKIAKQGENSTASIFFTDGSVTKTGIAGYGIHTVIKINGQNAYSLSEKARISNYVSPQIAELASIKCALGNANRACTNSSETLPSSGNIFINSDSLGALQAIQRFPPKDNKALLGEIHKLTGNLENNNRYTTYTWLPSHVGIKGNEAADTLATAATLFSKVQVATDNSNSAVFRGLRKKSIKLWKTSVSKRPEGYIKRYLKINPNLTRSKYNKILKLKRKTSVWITRLTHHDLTTCPFGQCLFLSCGECEHSTFSSTHYLTKCPANKTYIDSLNKLLTPRELRLSDELRARLILRYSDKDPSLLAEYIQNKPPNFSCMEGHVHFLNYGIRNTR